MLHQGTFERKTIRICTASKQIELDVCFVKQVHVLVRNIGGVEFAAELSLDPPLGIWIQHAALEDEQEQHSSEEGAYVHRVQARFTCTSIIIVP